MVDIAVALYDLINTKTAITNIVGARIYNDAPPETMDPPALIFWAITSRVWATVRDSKEVGLEQTTFQVDAYGRTRSEANQLAWNIWNELDGFAGVQSGVQIRDLSRGEGGVTHDFDPVSGGTDQRRFIASQDFVISFDCLNTYV